MVGEVLDGGGTDWDEAGEGRRQAAFWVNAQTYSERFTERGRRREIGAMNFLRDLGILAANSLPAESGTSHGTSAGRRWVDVD